MQAMPLASDSIPQHRDPEPMVAAIRRHQDAVWRYLRWLGCDPETSRDLTQEVFLVLLDRPFEHRSKTETRSFLRRTALNLWRDHRRSRELRVEQEWVDEVTRGFVTSEVRRGERLEALLRCVGGLPERARSALGWYYEEGCAQEEIARRLGLGRGGVKTMLQRIRKSLRECVEREWSPES